MEKAKLLIWLILLICSFTVDAISLINKIEYQGNKITQSSVLNREIYISAGDEFDVSLIEKSRQAIMDLGLFKSVHYRIEKEHHKNKGIFSQSINIIFVVEEKYYLLVIPRLKLDDDEVYYGVQLKWDNVFGLNHETRILVEDRGTTNDVNENRYSFRYLYPNIHNTAYSIELIMQTKNEVDTSEGVVDEQDDVFTLATSRWLNDKGRNHGNFVGGRISYLTRFNEDLITASNSESLDAVVFGVDVGYRDLNTYEYNRGGKDFGYKLDFSHESLGSQSEFTKHLFYYRSYYKFKEHPISNLNVQMQFGHANNLILGEYAFNLGNSTDLRGYENNRFSGNTMLLTNVEYMFPKKKYPVIRYVAFIDVGNTYVELSDVFHDGLNVGAGLGLRWKIKAFVKIDLRADVGYGFTDEDYRFSFGTRHVF